MKKRICRSNWAVGPKLDSDETVVHRSTIYKIVAYRQKDARLRMSERMARGLTPREQNANEAATFRLREVFVSAASDAAAKLRW